MKGFAFNFVLEQRLKITRKKPVLCFSGSSCLRINCIEGLFQLHNLFKTRTYVSQFFEVARRGRVDSGIDSSISSVFLHLTPALFFKCLNIQKFWSEVDAKHFHLLVSTGQSKVPSISQLKLRRKTYNQCQCYEKI